MEYVPIRGHYDYDIVLLNQLRPLLIKGCTAKQIREVTGWSEKYTSELLTGFKDSGWIKKKLKRKGRWVLTDFAP